MSEFIEMLDKIARETQKANPKNEKDYIKDGLLYCGECHTPKETLQTVNGKERKFACSCVCASKKREQERRKLKEQEKLERIHQLRINGIQDRTVRKCTFEAGNGENKPILSRCKKYVECWPDMVTENIGLLFWGNTGNGKTFAAACIANALIDRNIPVLMTSFNKILAAVTGMFEEDRIAYIESLSEFKLLILDDLGAERQSQFSTELLYTVIDNRYKNKLPLIVTTNTTLNEMKNNEDMTYQRIYDRILEMCIPLHFKGESLRTQKANDKLKRAREILSIKGD